MEDRERLYITPEIEKRKYRRVRLVTQMRCEAVGREDLMVTRDLSVGGVAVSTERPYPRDSEVALSFHLGPSATVISCRGKVAYSLEGLGMGIQFIDLTEESRQALQKFVDEAA